jgi:integrating conjugative element protein (TIGR03755 family)
MTRLKAGVLAGLLMFTMSGSAVADDDYEFIYQLGGGAALGNAATNRDNTIIIGGSAGWNTDLMCGNFDINLSIQNQLNGVSGAFQNLMDNVINAASGVVASLPALVLQRLNPALYDLLQNGILQASEEFHLGEVTCEGIVEDMKKTNEGEGWDSVAVSRFWANASQSPDQDILLVEEEADEAGMNAGVPWLGGEDRGGLNQAPIQTIRDTATAGYNLLLNREPNAVGGNCAEALICSTWATSTEAADWVVRVLGEKQIRTCMNCEKIASQAGMGLLRQYEITLEEVALGITELVNSNAAPNSEQLALVSAGNGVIVTRPVIEAIRAERARGALIQRLASEVALARTLESALMARRALLAGRKEPNIASVEKAQSEIETTIDELNGEIENMLFEMDVRQRMAGNTTLSLMLRNNQRGALPVGEDGQEQTMEDGGVSTE